MSLETKLESEATLQDVLDFINNCNYISIILREGGYKAFCYLSESDKWNSPNCTIWITDTKLPIAENKVTVEYRKETIFSQSSPESVDLTIEKLKKRTEELSELKLGDLNKEFIGHSKIIKK